MGGEWHGKLWVWFGRILWIGLKCSLLRWEWLIKLGVACMGGEWHGKLWVWFGRILWIGLKCSL